MILATRLRHTTRTTRPGTPTAPRRPSTCYHPPCPRPRLPSVEFCSSSSSSSSNNGDGKGWHRSGLLPPYPRPSPAKMPRIQPQKPTAVPAGSPSPRGSLCRHPCSRNRAAYGRGSLPTLQKALYRTGTRLRGLRSSVAMTAIGVSILVAWWTSGERRKRRRGQRRWTVLRRPPCGPCFRSPGPCRGGESALQRGVVRGSLSKVFLRMCCDILLVS